MQGGGRLGGLGGEFYARGSGVATDSADKVYVADTASNRIQKFDSSGNFLLAWGKNVNVFGSTDDGFETCNVASFCKTGQVGGLGGEFLGPQGAAADATGNLYVADSGKHRIQKFDSSGNFVLTLG